MISVEEAKDLIIKNLFRLVPSEKNISECLGSVLSRDIISPISYPPFDQSAMDGFALGYSDFQKSMPLEIIGESAAGNPFAAALKPGQAIRIFTGAKIPVGSDAVVTQEKASVEKGKLIIQDKSLEQGANIRTTGSQIMKGDVILKKGQAINPGAIGLLASLGITEVNVYSSTRVTLIVTGNEFVKPGNSLNEGQVYESNSYCIKAALEAANCKSIEIVNVGDDEKQTTEKLKSAIEKSDLVLATGGISVGKYDFVGKAFQQLGVQHIFYKIAQKPGKPLFFGKLNSCLIFGLPGNPAAALTCFYEYVLTAIKIMQGRSDISLTKKMMPVSENTSKKEGLSLFLKGKIAEGKVAVLEGQESSNISSFAMADCLIYLPAQKGSISAGELVEIHLLP
ncbi:MAG: molybdopterin molybdenumtransferase MoeA [Bacteroidetes bacterium]|nr:MAG: molybdopterin molybdenumtransferase MoeA [Bacteroidota bacterium]